MTMTAVNPHTGEKLRDYPTLSAEQTQAAVAHAHGTFVHYRRTTFAERAAWMNRAAELLEERAESLAQLATNEMGKTLEASRQEVLKCAKVCRYYAEHAEQFLTPQPAETDAERAEVRYLPLGAVLAVMPWNFPFWQVFRFAAPTLMAGNTALLKHASNVPGCALAIEEIFRDAGLPQGTFQTLMIGSRDVEAVLRDERVKAVSLTGSEGAGRAVSSVAGDALKPALMELGGSDPFIVMPSADLDAAVSSAVTSRTINNGQSCIAAKRFIVHRDVYEAFRDRFVATMRELKLGDPMDPLTDLGPLATAQIRDELHEQVQDAVSKGAELLLGGEMPQGSGYHYPATVLGGLNAEMDVWWEETFGPVASLYVVDNIEQAIALANATRFGLSSSAWTRDAAEQERFIEELEAGATFLNSMSVSDPRLPFGGVKASGFGRELGREGILEFVNIKAVSVGGGSHAGAKTE
ncbi:succinate-semialdehyde dehydrogenase [Deinococcus piscis]|uniref:Succinate-semialdehyde dehydrogenase n=1 Tax=Deinococcus piscis TaxID=394230 RepID=A0ABQ3K0K4_9DEIO|nr:NAD-dependent succinate-semialdehyde dehydrogenase [Deinococcus piscis]GHF93692.1 succinate-semialdehyde dehydrogenase [Deinococcus piscis]